MKKFFALAALVSVALTGCVTNEQFEDAEPAEIVMQAVNKVPNRAIVSGPTFSGDFKVFGFFSENDFTSTDPFGMYDVVCTKVGEHYKNSTTSYYWPMSGKVGFYAVAPASIDPTTVSWADGLTLTNYNVNDAKVTDVMFAYNWGQKGSSALDMVFYHALSQVLVQVKTNEDYDAVIKVKSVSFTNVDVVATCNYKESSTADQTPNPSITWTGNTDYTATEDYYATESDPVTVTSSAVDYGAGILTIPQTMGANAKISIAYTLTQNGKTISGTVSPAITEAWVAGKRYIYTLNFKLDEITFNPSVTDWVDVTTDAISIEG